MKRFSFRLESVLKLRAHKEEDWRNRLASATQRCNVLQQQIELMLKERVSVFGANAGNDMTYHLSRALYLGRIEDRSRELEKDLVQARLEREKVLTDYTKVRQEYEAVRRLKEKRVKEYKKAWFAEEGKELDDIANSRVVPEESQAIGGANG